MKKLKLLFVLLLMLTRFSAMSKDGSVIKGKVDPLGRYVMIDGAFNAPKITLINVGSIPFMIVLGSQNRILAVDASESQIEDLLKRMYDEKK